MTRDEFLKILEEALAGEVPEAVIRDNLNYYSSYIAQETAKGRTVSEIVEEIGEPRMLARTIIDSSEAGGETGATDNGTNSGYGTYDNPNRAGADAPAGGTYAQFGSHYFDLSKWYWKILIPLILVAVLVFGIFVAGGLLYLVMTFAGPILIIWLLYRLFKGMRE